MNNRNTSTFNDAAGTMFAALRASITHTHTHIRGNVGRRRRAGFYNRFAELNSSNDLEDAGTTVPLSVVHARTRTRIYIFLRQLTKRFLEKKEKKEEKKKKKREGNDGGVSLYNILMRRDCVLNIYVRGYWFLFLEVFATRGIASNSKRRRLRFPPLPPVLSSNLCWTFYRVSGK